jgi:hypothetical protein
MPVAVPVLPLALGQVLWQGQVPLAVLPLALAQTPFS